MVTTSNILKALTITVLVCTSGCITYERNQRTPYTVVEPDEDYYYDESDERAISAPERTSPIASSGNRVERIAPRKINPSAVRRPIAPSAPMTRFALDYRKQAAEHVYRLNKDRIYQGVLPPLLQAIGVMEITVDNRGQITNIHWLRKPNHVPAVAKQMETLARGASPYPAPAAQFETVFTETWLWHESGKFQLRSLTEGQSGGETKKVSGAPSKVHFL